MESDQYLLIHHFNIEDDKDCNEIYFLIKSTITMMIKLFFDI